MDISLSLEVFKALTNRLSHEGQTYDDLLRNLLELDSPQECEDNGENPELSRRIAHITENIARSLDPSSFHSRGLRLPHGTALKARYKGELYSAHIEDGRWVNADGSTSTSPSAAASAITGNNVNGLRFWEAQCPGDRNWLRLDILNAK